MPAKITIRVPEELRHRLKIALAQRGETLQEVLTAAVERYVKQTEKNGGGNYDRR